MRRLLTWALLLVATVLLARPAAAQLPTCAAGTSPFTLTGGASYAVVAAGVPLSTHAQLHVALGVALVRQVTAPGTPVTVMQAAEWRINCLPVASAPVPPPPPPPPPTTAWVLTMVSKTPLADTTRLSVLVRVYRRDGSPVVGVPIVWEVVGTDGGFTNAMIPTVTSLTNAQGESVEGWRTVPGVVNQIRVKADSSNWLHISHGAAEVATPLAMTVTVGDPVVIDAEWLDLGWDSVWVRLVGPGSIGDVVHIAPPGTTAWTWALPFDGAALLEGSADLLLTARACVGPVGQIRLGARPSCRERSWYVRAP